MWLNTRPVIWEETRWKGKVLGADDAEEDEQAAILKKALVVLNKLTLTNFDKLAAQWLNTGICGTDELVKAGVSVVVTKAQQEAEPVPTPTEARKTAALNALLTPTSAGSA